MTLTSSAQPSPLLSVTQLPAFHPGLQVPHSHPRRPPPALSPEPCPLLGAPPPLPTCWTPGRGPEVSESPGSRVPREASPLSATITPRCPPGPVSQLFHWTLSSASGAVLRPPRCTYVLGGPHPPAPRAEQKLVLPPRGSWHLSAALCPATTQAPGGGVPRGGGGLQTPFSPPEALPPTAAFLFGLRQRPEGKGQRAAGPSPPAQGLPCRPGSPVPGEPSRVVPEDPHSPPPAHPPLWGPRTRAGGHRSGPASRLLGNRSSSLGRLPSEWVTWTPSRPEHQGRSHPPFLEVGGSERLGRGSCPPRGLQRGPSPSAPGNPKGALTSGGPAAPE